MSLCIEQIDGPQGLSRKTKRRRWVKNQRNRKIRRVNKEEIPNIKYAGWEY